MSDKKTSNIQKKKKDEKGKDLVKYATFDPSSLKIKFTQSRVSVELTDFQKFISGLIDNVGDTSTLDVSSLIFTCKKGYNHNFAVSNFDLKYLADHHVPIADFFAFNSLVDDHPSIHWNPTIVSKEVYTANDYVNAIFVYYYLGLTKARIKLNADEKLPSFITKRVTLKYPVIMDILSRNDIDRFNNKWVLYYNLDWFSQEATNRISKGVAGHRSINVFQRYAWKSDLSEDLKELCSLLQVIAVRGPYIELHPYSSTSELQALSFGRSLSNLILQCFDQETIDKMVRDRAIFGYPSYTEGLDNYLKWTKDTLEFIKTPILRNKKAIEQGFEGKVLIKEYPALGESRHDEESKEDE